MKVDLVQISGGNLGLGRLESTVNVKFVSADPAGVSEAIHLV